MEFKGQELVGYDQKPEKPIKPQLLEMRQFLMRLDRALLKMNGNLEKTAENLADQRNRLASTASSSSINVSTRSSAYSSSRKIG